MPSILMAPRVLRSVLGGEKYPVVSVPTVNKNTKKMNFEKFVEEPWRSSQFIKIIDNTGTKLKASNIGTNHLDHSKLLGWLLASAELLPRVC